MKRHLYIRIYFAFLAIAFLSTMAVGMLGRAMHPEWRTGPAGTEAAATLVMEGVDDADLDGSLHARAEQLGIRLALFAPDHSVLATTDAALPAPKHEGWVRTKHAIGVATLLDDGRWLIVAMEQAPKHRQGLFFVWAVLGLVALGCMPLARSITRRMEALERAVSAWGEGDLSARVPVCGHDEVARLAERFNDSASRIEQLMATQRRVLAHASHELRSPLARLRLALALLDEDPHVLEAVRNVEELDALIEDLLLSARLQAGRTELSTHPTDLGALVASEAARVDATSTGSASASVDPRLVGLAVRNLLENARKHGGGAIEASVEATDVVRIRVCDRGPGVPEALRTRIFEPYFRPEGHSEADGGLGLGLALVARVAEAHGGTATCTEREGGGACFELTLPI
jgi:signal transduction histidine kinase